MTFRALIFGALLPASAAAAGAAELPAVNSQRYCAAMFPATESGAGPSDILLQGCQAVEAKFRAKAARLWSETPEDVRERCVEAQIFTPAGVSYEGLARCFARHMAHIDEEMLETISK